ncbi:MAG: hypothetical protein N2C12_02260 [Planctomycetales bacterium]
MNRLEPDAIANTSSRVERSPYPAALATEPGLSVFAPLHYESNYAYPLLVWLHGAGHNEGQLRSLMPRISMRNYAAVAPRGTTNMGNLDSGDSTSTCSEEFTWCQSEQHIRWAHERVGNAVDQATKRLNIHSQRIFLAGHGSGGTMAFRIAMMLPEQVCGVLSLGGAFPRGHAPLRRLLEVRKLPLFVAVNRDNPSYSDTEVCENLRLFHTAGMAATLRQYPPDNDLSDLMLADVDRWIMDTIAEQQHAVVAS